MRDKIVDIWDEIESVVLLNQSMPIQNYKEVKERMIKRFSRDLVPSLDDWEVVRECHNVGTEGHNHPANPCPVCKGTGTITHPLVWEDVPKLLNNTMDITIEGKNMGTYICMELPDGEKVRRKG